MPPKPGKTGVMRAMAKVCPTKREVNDYVE